MFLKAQPIWIKGKEREQNVFAVFSTNIFLKPGAKLHITGATFYRVFVNGKFVGFGPARTAHGHNGQTYAREDVFSLDFTLEEESSCEIIIEAAGYYCRSLSSILQPSFVMAEVQCEGEVLAYTGHDFEGYLSPCRLQQVERYSYQRHFSEVWDYRNVSSVTDEAYKAQIEVLPNTYSILDRRAPYPLYEDIELSGIHCRGNYVYDETLPFHEMKYSTGTLPEGWGEFDWDSIPNHPFTWLQRQKQTITECESDRQLAFPVVLKKGEYAILDFGQLEAGFIKAVIETLEESDIVIGFSEFYMGEEFHFTKMNAHNVLEYFFDRENDREILSFEPYTFRFAMIAVKEGCICLKNFGVKTFMFDLSQISYPDFKDETLNRIYRAAARTFAHNSVDIYMDCPSRERAGWLCDSYFTSKAEYALTGQTGVEDAFLENFRLYENRGELPQGMIPMCYPADIENNHKFIPQWSMWYILEVEEYVNKRGHKDLAEEFRQSVYGLLDFYRQYENEDGLLERLPSWNFVEWSKANSWTWDVNYPTNFLYAQVLECIDRLYDDEECRKRSEEVRRAAVEQSFNGRYFLDHAVRDENGKLCLLEDCSEACQYYAVLFGGIDIRSEKYRQLEHLILHVFAPERKEPMPEIMEVNAFIGLYLRLEVLLQMKEYELLLDNVKGFFGNMEQYTGTLWEYRQFVGSYDHGFASYALLAIQEAVSGLRS